MAEMSPPRMDMIVQRQLDVMTTGNSAYLAIFLRAVKAAGTRVRIVFAPMRSFGTGLCLRRSGDASLSGLPRR